MAKRVSMNERRQQDRAQQGRGEDALYPAVQQEELGDIKLEKMTLYVKPRHKRALEVIQARCIINGEEKPDKSKLVQEAFELLIQKYNLTDEQLNSNTATQQHSTR